MYWPIEYSKDGRWIPSLVIKANDVHEVCSYMIGLRWNPTFYRIGHPTKMLLNEGTVIILKGVSA